MDALVGEITQSVQALRDSWQQGKSEPADTSAPPIASPELQELRQRLVEASWQLYQHALGPREYLISLSVSVHYTACLKWLCRFGVFNGVPLEGSIAYDKLAAAISVPGGTLKSVARMAMTSGLFSEPTPNHIAHSPTSAMIASNANLLLCAKFMTEVGVPTASAFADATQRWPGSLSNTETAYNLAFDTQLPLFEHLKTLPTRTEQFAGYMKSVTNSEGTSLKHLVNGYDWGVLLQDSLVVDVGGSTGHASIAIAETFPGLRFVVQDLATNADAGRELLANAGENEAQKDLAARITFQAHDFFEDQPIVGADVYLLRMIIHDWSDDGSVRILSRIVKAMEPNKAKSSLVIMDSVLPLPGQLPATQERLLRLRDLTMRQVFNSRERTPEEWSALMARVDPALKLVKTTKPPGSVLSIMEWKFDHPVTQITAPSKYSKSMFSEFIRSYHHMEW
ncbi:O-methyltransferase-domain-containing protein [Aspergillus foveolatus]|uniref:O-methyltransferase-domain-containing protein n=1 Tax=Aspergillus foveolatus TaxID=210207 RepID=UPI003CCDE2A6